MNITLLSNREFVDLETVVPERKPSCSDLLPLFMKCGIVKPEDALWCVGKLYNDKFHSILLRVNHDF